MPNTPGPGTDRATRLARGAALSGTSGKLCPADQARRLLEAIIEPGDRVAIEGDNQKQANFLASALAQVDPARLHDLHVVQSVVAPPDHFAVFERGIANRLDFAYAGPQSRRLAELVASRAPSRSAQHMGTGCRTPA
jgi:malonate decarboxylase alpha subunit